MADPLIQTTIFEKDGILAVLSLLASTAGTVIGRYDPRVNPMIDFAIMTTPKVGIEKFQESIEVSVDNGHKVVFRGTPNNARLS